MQRVIVKKLFKRYNLSSILVFIPSVGEFVILELLGGSDTLMIGKVLWHEFFQQHVLSGGFCDSNNYTGDFGTPDPAFSSLSLRRAARMNSEHRTEAEKFLQQNPAIHEFDLLLPDMNAVLRGKRILREKLLNIYKKGFYFPVSVFGMDVTGETMEETGLGFESGDQDLPCYPIPKSLKLVPWRKERGQLLLRMFEVDGSPFYGNPREVLKSVCLKMADSGWSAVVAIEMEFFLTDQKRRQGHPPRPASSPVSGQLESEGQLYSLTSLDNYDSFLKDISDSADKQNVPVDTTLAELSPGQFEINLHHVPDAIQACDHAILLKRIICCINSAPMAGSISSSPCPPNARVELKPPAMLLSIHPREIRQRNT